MELLDLIQNGRDMHVKMDDHERMLKKDSHFSSELELRLGPPGTDEDWSFYSTKNDESALSFGSKQQSFSSILHVSSTLRLPVMSKESSQLCNTSTTKVGDLKCSVNKAFSTVSASANTAVPGCSSHKRTAPAPAPVVGWPPIRSFRKNLASKQTLGLEDETSTKIANDKSVQKSGKGMFVKVNMDGVPIGRKVDLNAFDSYYKLSSAVDELFQGLLAAQRDSSAVGNQSRQDDKKLITGLRNGNGEYTLVYEDNEGDRMLVGDVPWQDICRRISIYYDLSPETLAKYYKYFCGYSAACLSLR